MFIKNRIIIYALHIYGRMPSSLHPRRGKLISDVLYFRSKAEAAYYQKAHYAHSESVLKEVDAIEYNGQIRHFHYRPSAANHRFGPYILDDNLRLEILKQDEFVLVGLNRPHPNKRIAGSPSSYKDVRHFIWAGKLKNDLVIKDAKLLNKPIEFADQRSLKSVT